MDPIECAGFTFTSNFDSGNLLKVELVSRKDSRSTKPTSLSDEPDVEFNVWTRPDCAGTPYENCNRTWFHFGVRGGTSRMLVKLNLVELSRQSKLYGQGMAPVTRALPGRSNWERIRDRPAFRADSVLGFVLSFRYFSPENPRTTQYFAFTYPLSYTELQTQLAALDERHMVTTGPASLDHIYYVRETLCRTLEGRRVDLLTISSHHGITLEREPRLAHLFPDTNQPRPFKFLDKKVIFVSARVHPGETPASFVLNGFLNLLLSRENIIAQTLRRLYVFKLIPCLNPDGVYHGHYRTDTRGANLNRFYLRPSLQEHPAIWAARALIRYHHHGIELPDTELEETNPPQDRGDPPITEINNSGLFLYIDMHGHASKKGIFMYGNHLQDSAANVECMLLPKLMSLNSAHFHFYACNFTERNMYLRDKRDGLSREGSGRVAVLKLTGLVRSYTLECNYNTGRMLNVVPAPTRSPASANSSSGATPAVVPPKFTPLIYEEAGRALGPSILDLTGDNPNSRLPNSEFRNLNNVREWLKWYLIGQLSTPGEPSTPKLHQVRTSVGARKVAPVSSAGLVDRKENLNVQQPGCSSSTGVPRSKFTAPTIASHLKTKEVIGSGNKSAPVPGDCARPSKPPAVRTHLNICLLGKKYVAPAVDSSSATTSPVPTGTVTPVVSKTATTSTLKKVRMRKPLRRLTTSSDVTYRRLIKNKKRKKKKAKFI